MRAKWRKRALIAVSALFAGLLMSVGLPELAADLSDVLTVHADGVNVVNFVAKTAEANSSNVVYVDIEAKGNPSESVVVSYRTSSGTAIENVDYLGVFNSVALKLDPSGYAKHTLSVQCLNTPENREKLRVYDDKDTYGRYFNLALLSVDNGQIGENSNCKCYLTYDYKVSATTGIDDGVLTREVAYLDDYKTMMSKYHEGENDISGKETWKTWKKGVSFNNDETKRWVNAYINSGFANAYCSYVLDSIDDDKIHSNSNIYMLSGNKEFMDKYERDSSCPGLSLYYEIEPCTKGGYRIDGKAMYYISKDINPWKQKGDLVDLEELHVVGPNKQIYWIQEKDVWYSSKNSIYDSIFYKTDPYCGVLDYGLAIFNNNKSWDREVHDIWLFMTLVDDKCPTIQNQYAEFNPQTGTIRIYLRFNEPVYSSKKKDIQVKINNYGTTYYAGYVDGNYSDTLVYEIPADDTPYVKIDSVTYQLPNEDIGDMAYNLDAYKIVRNNLAQNTDQNRGADITTGIIDLARPHLSVDIATSTKPRNIYNIMVSANNNGESSFDSGTVYYAWDKNEYIDDPTSPASYDNSHVLASEERGSFALTLSKSQVGESGNYYLHALAVSKYGLTAHSTFGPYCLDGDAPIVKQLDIDPNDLKSKTFRLDAEAKPLGTSIQDVTLAVKYQGDDDAEHVDRLGLVQDGDIVAALSGRVGRSEEEGHTVYSYRSNIDEDDDSIPFDTFISNIMGTHSRLSAEVFFEVSDTAGNKGKTESFKTVYDKRELFECLVTPPASYEEDTSITLPSKVYDIQNAAPADGMRFELTDPDDKALIDGGAKFSVVVNNGTEFAADGYAATLSGLPAGYYEAVGRVTGTVSETEVDLISRSVSFYLTNGFADETTNKRNAQGDLVLTNHVYELEDARFYYFNPANTSIASHLYGAAYSDSTGKYEGGAANPAFSSVVEAKKYVKFMEYQDLELIAISDTIASFLNAASGSTVYVKAAKETKNAQEGQLWVRYKKASWAPNSTASSWAFYYYGEGKVENGININGLSANLSSSIDTVTNRIVDAGKDVYLVGEDNRHRVTGAPYLTAAQMHVAPESASSTRTGIAYVTNPTYAGDAQLYKNNVKVNGESYPLATNLELSITSATVLYFKHVGANEWTPISVENGTLLKNALAQQATGLYAIREYSEQGVSEFTVYIDKNLPALEVTLNKGLAEERTLTLDGEVTSVTCKNLCLDSLVGEVDEDCYVAIYSYPNRSLSTVLYGGAIAGYMLSDGNYYVEVGDRSGNFATYTVLTSDSPIELSISESESKTTVVVRVDNRSDSEIYSYEVYLNDNLLDSEFDTVKRYRGAGIYRVEVTDIYGNREVQTFTHESPSPELKWYYLNDNGGYSVYDPNKPVRMVLEDDPTSSRTTYVHSSTMVRVLFDSSYSSDDVEFEVLDIPNTDYTYNASTGLLSLNTLSSWRLRVWYKNQPSNDHLYVFDIDTTGPEVSSSFIGTGYQTHMTLDEDDNVITTSSFDSMDFSKYEEGDVATLDDLMYEKTGSVSLSFADGAVIQSNHIVLRFSDPSGIRSVTVTRNGQPLEMELSDEGELTIRNYGAYVITVVDNLGNTTTFSFINVEGDVSSATIDGEVLAQDIMTYGHQEAEILTEYEGVTTFLVKTANGSETFEFRYQDGTLTFGQYYVHFERYIDDEDVERLVGSADYAVTSGFALYANGELTRRDTWYAAVERDDYVLYAMIDESGRAHFKIATNGPEVSFEARYLVNNVHLPNRYVATLSTENPALTLLTGGEVVIKNPALDYIYVTNDLTIDKTQIASNITRIEYVYSTTPEFGEMATLYENGAWVADFVGSEYGFYQIVVTNVFNNHTIYHISKIQSFASVVTIHCLDGREVTFYDNDGAIYSNYSIELMIMSDDVYFEVNGVRSSGYVESGTTNLLLNRDGTYAVRVVGSNGIFEDFTFEIKADASFLYKESWITGYNEEALLYEQGYTNTLCSVVRDEDVVFIDMTYDDDFYVVLYDSITDTGKTDEAALHQAIGRYGIGKYTVGFRNKYGDLVTKTVHYNNVPSLVLTRIITSDPMTYQAFDLDFALEKGFYSNYVLCFSTSSDTYVFTIEGVEYRLDEPKKIEFSNISGKGSFSYHVTYLDEYGNYIEFEAVLFREDVTFDTSKMSTISVGTTLYTKDDVCITFADGLKATVSVDGGEAKDYLSGTVYYADGEYLFTVRDIAGNNVTYTIVHKSANHYTLTNSGTGEDVIDGGVVNNSSVVFASDDGSKIKYVVRNGELLSEYGSNTFSTTGHYEILIEDAIGNQSYEEFYIINNELAEFSYTAPFEYEITEVWRIAADGGRELLNVRGPSVTLNTNGDYVVVVTSTKTTSSFNFSVSINRTPPSATLVGVEDGGVTGRDVTLSGLKSGDVVKVYKDGVLISTTAVTISTEFTAISSSGKYRITVTNLQGVTIEYTFTRKPIANVAGSVFVIVSAALLVVGIGIGLVYHTKLKTDD